MYVGKKGTEPRDYSRNQLAQPFIGIKANFFKKPEGKIPDWLSITFMGFAYTLQDNNTIGSKHDGETEYIYILTGEKARKSAKFRHFPRARERKIQCISFWTSGSSIVHRIYPVRKVVSHTVS
jgi:hypothetical protein